MIYASILLADNNNPPPPQNDIACLHQCWGLTSRVRSAPFSGFGRKIAAFYFLLILTQISNCCFPPSIRFVYNKLSNIVLNYDKAVAKSLSSEVAVRLLGDRMLSCQIWGLATISVSARMKHKIALSHQIPIRENVCGMTGSSTRTTFKWPEKDEGGKSDWGTRSVPSLIWLSTLLGSDPEPHNNTTCTPCFSAGAQGYGSSPTALRWTVRNIRAFMSLVR